MAQRKRQYGSGILLKRERGWAIRWRELQIAPDGTVKRALRYENLGEISRGDAADILALKVGVAANSKVPTRSRVTFRTIVEDWKTNVMPMYKHSTQRNHRHVAEKHLVPRFGDTAISDVTRQEVQAYVAHLMKAGYAPKTIDHIHDVLSAVLRTAVKWGHLQANPAREIDLPTLRCVRPKWALTTAQAVALLDALAALPKTMAGLAILTGLRRGELFALRWQDLDLAERSLTVREAVYEGIFGTPKTEAGLRRVPLSVAATRLIETWQRRVTPVEPEALVFATWSGKPISPNNVLKHIVAAAKVLGLPTISWLTFRRTYSSWAHEKGVPGKVVATLMGHAKVDTTLNVYTQVLDHSLRGAAEKVGSELITIDHKSDGTSGVTDQNA
jgi:integrase